jgi:hypothetical protein
MSLPNKLALLLSLAASPAFAKEPAVVFAGVPGKEAPVAMIGFEDAYTEPMDNCQQHIAEVVVGEIAYDGPSEIIAGFRVDPAKSTNGVTLYRIDPADITAGKMRQLQKIVRKGARLVVLAQTCGMGHFTSVRELWLKNALGQ